MKHIASSVRMFLFARRRVSASATSLINVDVYFRWSGTESHIEKDSDQQNLEHANLSGLAVA